MSYPDWTRVNSRTRDGVPFGILLFLIVFSPLAFGTVEPWSLAMMESAALLCVSLLLSRSLRSHDQGFTEVPGIVPLLLLLGFIALQALPLPPSLLKIISPHTHSIYEETVWVIQPGAWVSLSISRKATCSEFFRYASYAAVYISTVQLLTTYGLLRRIVMILVGFATLLALFSMLQHLVSNNRIYWVRELTQGGTPFGPYVNRNHYAGLIGMVFPVILSLFLLYRPPSNNAPLRKRIAETFNHPMTNIHALLGFSAILTATSVFVSLSRGGIASIILSLIFLGFLLNRKMRMHRKGLLLAIIVIVILYAVGWFGWDPIFERFRNIRTTQGDISELRIDIWEDSARIIRDFFLTGTGFGSFIHIYPAYRTIESEGIADHAHNDFIELLTDGGIIAMLLFMWFMTSVLSRSFRTFSRRQDPFPLYLYAGSVTGILSILLHSFTDFNLQIGANGLYLFFLLGLCVSAAHTRLMEDDTGTLLARTGQGGIKLFFPVALVALLGCAFFFTGQFFGSFLQNEVEGILLDSGSTKALRASVQDTLRRASVFDPLEASYNCGAAAAGSLLPDDTAASSRFLRCLELRPTDSRHLQAFGLFLAKTGKREVAEQLFRAAVTYNRTDPAPRRTYGVWLIGEGRTDEGLSSIKSAISIEPARTSEYVTLLVLTGLNDQEIAGALPAESQPHLIFAGYLEKTGRDDMAAAEYMKAVTYAQGDRNAAPSTFHAAYQFYRAQGMNRPAADTLKKGIELFPKDVTLKMRLAETYESLGQKDDASAQYRQIIEIDRANDRARKKLEELR